MYRSAGDTQLICDGSVWHLYSSVACRLIREAVPNAKAIVMVRDPIELMRSLHARNLVFGDEDIADFSAALEAEPARAAGRRLPRDFAFAEALLYSRIGRLGEQADRLLESFPRHHVHFVVLDDLAADAAREFKQVQDFIGVEHWLPETIEHYNPNRIERSAFVKRALYQDRWSLRAVTRAVLSPRLRMALRSTATWRKIARANAPVAQREPLDPALRDRLREMLGPDVELLGRLVGRDLAGLWWGGSGTEPGALRS